MLRAALGLLAATALAACVPPQPGAGDRAAALAPPPTDPVFAFAASGAPGSEGSMVLPGSGVPVRLRMVRSYAAASGADCREIAEITAGGGERARLLCREPNGVWREARPLLGRADSRGVN